MANVTVEVHPMSALFDDPTMKRWRVMVDGMQHSVHPTETEANAAAQKARNLAASGWTKVSGQESRTGNAKKDWNRG